MYTRLFRCSLLCARRSPALTNQVNFKIFFFLTVKSISPHIRIWYQALDSRPIKGCSISHIRPLLRSYLNCRLCCCLMKVLQFKIGIDLGLSRVCSCTIVYTRRNIIRYRGRYTWAYSWWQVWRRWWGWGWTAWILSLWRQRVQGGCSCRCPPI